MDTAVKPQGCTNLKLRQLMRRVAQRYDAEVGKTGLRGTQYSLLSYVVKLGPGAAGGPGRGDEGRCLHAHAQPAAPDRRGWLVLEPGPDARSRLVRATPAGRDKRQEAQRRWRVAQESLNERLGVRRVVALHALLDECQDTVGGPSRRRRDD
jgi:hypothetical protein